MEYTTTEFEIKFLEERIIVLKQKEDLDRITKEGAVECVEKMMALCDMHDDPKAVLFYVKSLYIKKDAMRVFSESPNHKTAVCAGLITSSFLAKNVANMLLKMRARFIKGDDIPAQIFNTKPEAMKWVNSILASKA